MYPPADQSLFLKRKGLGEPQKNEGLWVQKKITLNGVQGSKETLKQKAG
jgi:hypothetical protein